MASEGGPYEDGVGEGDFITVTFNKPTNVVPLPTDASIRRLFNFSANLGSHLNAYVPAGGDERMGVGGPWSCGIFAGIRRYLRVLGGLVRGKGPALRAVGAPCDVVVLTQDLVH